MAQDLAVWGVAVPGTALREEALEVALANADALAAWLGCETQWRSVLGPTGAWVWTGLDYAAVDVVLRRQGPADADQVFADLQLMEREAIATFNEIAE